MATTAQHLAARNDQDLIDRLTARAEQSQVKNAAQWVEENLGALLTAQVASSSTIADIHGYAKNAYDQKVAALPPAPGKDPAAVTDEHISAAIAAVIAAA